MRQNFAVNTIKFVAVDLIGDVIYFPIWWFTKGAKKSLLFFGQKIANTEKYLGVGIWASNLFKPMFGQTDWQSKLISFFMRLFQIIVRTIALAVWTIILVSFFIIWMLVPILIVYQIYALIK